MTRIALIRGTDRRANVLHSLTALDDDIQPGKRILIKPNLVSTTNQLASTHVDALRGVLAFLRERSCTDITIGEGSSTRNTLDGYRNFGYTSLVDEFGVKLIDLNRDQWVRTKIFDDSFGDVEVRLARTVAESDYRISVCSPKTHDVVGVTLSLKNMAVGSLIRDELGTVRTLGGLAWQLFSTFILKRRETLRFVEGRVEGNSPLLSHSDKIAIHRGYPAINMTLARLAHLTFPHLSVIDGTVGMEGDGPTKGSPVDLGLVIAGTDYLAVDTMTARIMGFDPEEIGYLAYLSRMGVGTADPGKIEVIGEKPEDCLRPFRRHSSFESQTQWRLDHGAPGSVEKAVEMILKTVS